MTIWSDCSKASIDDLTLGEADKVPVSQVAKKQGVSEQTIYARRKRFGALEAADVRRLRQLEQENAKLKKLVARVEK